jgi:hypothetical protein
LDIFSELQLILPKVNGKLNSPTIDIMKVRINPSCRETRTVICPNDPIPLFLDLLPPPFTEEFTSSGDNRGPGAIRAAVWWFRLWKGKVFNFKTFTFFCPYIKGLFGDANHSCIVLSFFPRPFSPRQLER